MTKEVTKESFVKTASMSVQAQWKLLTRADDADKYIVEVGFPNKREELLMPLLKIQRAHLRTSIRMGAFEIIVLVCATWWHCLRAATAGHSISRSEEQERK